MHAPNARMTVVTLGLSFLVFAMMGCRKETHTRDMGVRESTNACAEAAPSQIGSVRLAKDQIYWAIYDHFNKVKAYRVMADLPEEIKGTSGWNHSPDSLPMTPGFTKTLFKALKATAPEIVAALPEALSCTDGPCLIQLLDPFIGSVYGASPHRETQRKVLLEYMNQLIKDGETPLRALEEGIFLSLTSPQFLFHKMERDPQGAYTAHSFAKSISLALWRSLPDQELSRMAENRTIFNVVKLDRKLKTMLADVKSTRFTNSFVDQWTGIENLPKLVDSETAALLMNETRYFFREMLVQDWDVRDLIYSDKVMMNNELAAYYFDYKGDELGSALRSMNFSKLVNMGIAQKGEFRGGIATQAAFLTTYSHRSKTSPVKRGKWLSEHFIGGKIDPPNNLPDEKEEEENGPQTARQASEKRMEDPTCAGCHQFMDPYGLALDSYDRRGIWRTTKIASIRPGIITVSSLELQQKC